MKKLLFLCFLTITFPFINALLFTGSIKVDTELKYPHRQVSFVADRMVYHEYQFFDNGVIRVNKGFYGYLLGTLYIVYLKKTYDYIPPGLDMSEQYKFDFENKGRTFVTATIKRIPNTDHQVVIRTTYPGEAREVEYSRGLVESKLQFK